MAEEQTIQPRQTAYKVSINSILNGKYIQQEGWQPNYIEINGKQVSRVNVIAALVDKQQTETLSTITLDDGTGAIQAKAFNEDTKKLNELNIGDVLLLIGRPRNYNNQLFVSVEIARKMDPLWGKIRKSELGDEPVTQETSQEKSPNEELIKTVSELDSGQGAETTQVLNKLNLEEQQGQALISELIKEGNIYEPKPGYLKSLD
tara:strand:+ start:330 stop:941 length:612 start_codon:yes stop_codon:yes gene_type:complete